MTEAEWLAATGKPASMLRRIRGRTPPARLQLLAALACRTIWNLLPGELHSAIDVLEHYALGIAAEEAYLSARLDAATFPASDSIARAAAAAVSAAVNGNVATGCELCLAWVVECAARASENRREGRDRSRTELCALVREVVGNPFRPWSTVPDFLGGGLLQPDGGSFRPSEDVVAIARSIVEWSAYDRMPILADALEDSGASDPVLLTHCRGSTPHTKGCWVLALLLGK